MTRGYKNLGSPLQVWDPEEEVVSVERGDGENRYLDASKRFDQGS
jgi:hypothetical protein